MKHSLPPYLGQPCSFAFTVDNDEVIFKGKFVNPATHSDLLVAGTATSRTPFCVLFSDGECKRYSKTQANRAVKLSHKIDLIAAIIAHVSIHDMLGLDSLAPLPQVQASFKETIGRDLRHHCFLSSLHSSRSSSPSSCDLWFRTGVARHVSAGHVAGVAVT